MNSRTSLTAVEKLQALGLKYYDDFKWEPEAGDYYTTSRNDLELYQVVEDHGDVFLTRYCDPQKGDSLSSWSKEEFLKGFGLKRVFVPNWILE